MPQKYLTDCRSFYSCLYCRTHLANHDELISRSFQGNRSRAYLFNSVINIITGPSVQRELNTGAHAVADIFCSNCSTTMGWKYEKAYVSSQKYKEGKFIIELAHVVRENRHLELDKRDMFLGVQSGLQSQSGVKSVGQMHQGSLSPPPAETGHWLSATHSTTSSSSSPPPSSSSSSSSSSSASSNGYGPSMATYNHSRDHDRIHADEDSSDDEEEVLMFPFHDDLFGERASYSNLSMSRLNQSYQKRIRRSLHLDSAPYDWKYSTKPAALPSRSPAPTSEPLQQAESSPQSISTPSASNYRVELSADDRDDLSDLSGSVHDDRVEVEIHQDDEIQFRLDPCEPSPASAEAAATTTATTSAACCRDRCCDQQLDLQQATTSGISKIAGQQPEACRKDAGMADRQLATSTTTTVSNSIDKPVNNETGLDRAHSLSLDDEEFYDCCSDHLVSNTSMVTLD